MHHIQRVLKDWPGVVTLLIIAVVIANGVVAVFRNWPGLIPWKPEGTGTITEIYLSLAAVGAIFAGFAGVIIVFGLTPTSELFRQFRRDSGERMSANWISVITSAFLGSAASIVAACLQEFNLGLIGSLFFELGCLLLLHSALRAVWILWLLLSLVQADDKADLQQRLGSPAQDAEERLPAAE